MRDGECHAHFLPALADVGLACRAPEWPKPLDEPRRARSNSVLAHAYPARRSPSPLRWHTSASSSNLLATRSRAAATRRDFRRRRLESRARHRDLCAAPGFLHAVLTHRQRRLRRGGGRRCVSTHLRTKRHAARSYNPPGGLRQSATVIRRDRIGVEFRGGFTGLGQPLCGRGVGACGKIAALKRRKDSLCRRRQHGHGVGRLWAACAGIAPDVAPRVRALRSTVRSILELVAEAIANCCRTRAPVAPDPIGNIELRLEFLDPVTPTHA